ncbi:hypothetical protein [Novosphingobium sp. BL-52-GroH]|uniref:hypothetical protein n=1 Tax=Novosphingobium sp. BL-52-GroH TaxID=3349877 RepID=UPI00384F4A49
MRYRFNADWGIHSDSIMCLIRSMLELPFEHDVSIARSGEIAAVMEAIASRSARPRYTFMVLDLIAGVADANGQAGPYVRQGKELVPIREWLADAMAPTAARHHQRRAIVESIRGELEVKGLLPKRDSDAKSLVAEEVALRVRSSGMTSVSRAVSELVRAGLITRHYQGYKVDHANRGAQRLAVYTVTSGAKAALGRV